jgi:hypothetical protein
VAVCGAVDWWRQETWSARGDLLSAWLEEPEIRANLEIILLGLRSVCDAWWLQAQVDVELLLEI